MYIQGLNHCAKAWLSNRYLISSSMKVKVQKTGMAGKAGPKSKDGNNGNRFSGDGISAALVTYATSFHWLLTIGESDCFRCAW